MLMTARPPFLAAFPISQARPGAAPRLSRRVGIVATLLAHLLLLFFLFKQAESMLDSQPAPPGLKTLNAFWIPAPNIAPKITAAAAPTPKISKPQPPKPKAQPRPQPPKPVADNRIVAVTPTPTVSAAPTPAAPAAAAPAAPAAAATVAAVATIAASPPPTTGDVANIATTASYVDLERLERMYAKLVSRTISVNQQYPVYSKQFGERGTAMVRVSLARDGSVLDAVVLTPTGYKYLDDEARNVMMRVGRFAPVPALLRQGSKVVVIDQPVKFDFR